MNILSKSAILLLCMGLSSAAWAATNRAVNVSGGSITLSDSSDVTITSASLALVKVTYDGSGNCLASSNADATCNSGATSVIVPAGTTLKFLIYVKNTTDLAIADLRFRDYLDDTNFVYTAASIKRVPSGSEPADTAAVSAIYTSANGGTAQTDAVSNADDAGINTAAAPDDLTVGAASNATVSVPAHKTFAVLFTAVKN